MEKIGSRVADLMAYLADMKVGHGWYRLAAGLRISRTRICSALADCQGHGLLGRHEGGLSLVNIGSRVVDSNHFKSDPDPDPYHSDANVRPHFEPRGILQNFKTTKFSSC